MEQRVVCLYRVSTKNQLTDGDIPMQENACRSFAASQSGWRIVTEYAERGVSGYHKSETQRDALIQIKRDAEKRCFDILLVFMFDRLGRREDETPFVVEWLHEHHVTVWSVTEGPQYFGRHSDRLVNYIRYWQSGGESGDTSLRVAEKHRQMVMDGIYRGGVPPFGYRLVPSGLFGKKGRERLKLAIYDPESRIIRIMYNYAYEHNAGCYSIAKHLNEQDYFTRYGHLWTTPTVSRILHNPIYKGDYVSGKFTNKKGKMTRNPPIQWTHARKTLVDLAIVDAVVWDAVNARWERNKPAEQAKKRENHAFSCNLWLKDHAFCSNCGAKLTSGGKGKRYDCPRRMRLDPCAGRFGYGAKKAEAVVWVEIVHILHHLHIEKFQKAVLNKKTQELNKREQTRVVLLKQKKHLITNASGYFTSENGCELLATQMTKTDQSIAAVEKQIAQIKKAPDPTNLDAYLFSEVLIKHEILTLLSERVELDRDLVKIKLRADFYKM